MKVIGGLFNDLLIICLLFLQGEPIDAALKKKRVAKEPKNVFPHY